MRRLYKAAMAGLAALYLTGCGEKAPELENLAVTHSWGQLDEAGLGLKFYRVLVESKKIGYDTVDSSDDGFLPDDADGCIDKAELIREDGSRKKCSEETKKVLTETILKHLQSRGN